MALQDLTPQLRTRLSRMERAVGWFLLLAVLLLAFGFFYYLYNTAERRGWFLTKATYFAFVKSATGLRVGDPVHLMGFDAGTIMRIEPMAGNQFTYNVYVEFNLKSPNYDYIWTEGSKARVAAADFLGKRSIQVTKGTGGYSTYIFHPLRSASLPEAEILGRDKLWVWAQEFTAEDGTILARPKDTILDIRALRTAGYTNGWIMNMDPDEIRKHMTGMWNFKSGRYETYTNKISTYWIEVEESPAVTERLESVVAKIEESLPGILNLTNQLASVLNNTDTLVSNLNVVAQRATPLMSNLAAATAQLDRPGGLGDWVIPTNISRQLETTLGTANKTIGTAGNTLESANTNLSLLVSNLSLSLDNLAGITSNLNHQVEANTNILTGISQAITSADELMRGLQHHWLLRSAFKEKKKGGKSDDRKFDPLPAPRPAPQQGRRG